MTKLDEVTKIILSKNLTVLGPRNRVGQMKGCMLK